MKDRYLEITFRKGKPLAAYLYLTGKKGVQCVKAIKIDEGLIADYDQNGVPVGVEIVVEHHKSLCLLLLDFSLPLIYTIIFYLYFHCLPPDYTN